MSNFRGAKGKNSVPQKLLHRPNTCLQSKCIFSKLLFIAFQQTVSQLTNSPHYLKFKF